MSVSDAHLLLKPALELAAMVRRGDLTARELTELAYARIETLDDDVGAFMHVDHERAFAAADAIEKGDDRPFAGVPIAIKDISVMLAGAPHTAGSKMFGDFRPDFDSNAARRIKDAGFVIVGKTKTPEMGILPVTEPRRYGPARNPYDLGRTPGGSSGGAAAAVAAGMVPIAHGSDGGGSLRIPGACCNLVGFKMSRNRVSPAPLLGDSFLTTEGVLGRTVADVAVSYDLLAGYELGDANPAPPPSTSFSQAVAREPGRLRIAFETRPPIDVEVDPRHVEAVHDAARLLEELGHDVEEIDVAWDSRHIIEVFKQLWSVQVAGLTTFAAAVSGNQVGPELLERMTWDFYERGARVTALELGSVDVQLKAYARAAIAATHQYDVIIAPVLAQRPLPIGTIDTDAGYDEFDKASDFTPFTAGMNVTGQPAVSLPWGIGDDGLPVAIQAIGRPYDDETLFSLAAQIERARPWIGDLPALAAA